jgi:hypothetical protein
LRVRRHRDDGDLVIRGSKAFHDCEQYGLRAWHKVRQPMVDFAGSAIELRQFSGIPPPAGTA